MTNYSSESKLRGYSKVAHCGWIDSILANRKQEMFPKIGTCRAKLPGRYSIVIGYGGKKGERVAEGLRVAMKQRGLKVFVAPRDMVATPDWKAAVRQKIETFDAYVLLCNKDACCSEVVMEEMDWAGPEKIIPFRLARQKVHPKAAKAHNFPYDTRHPNYDLYKDQIRTSIKEFRDKVRKANRSLLTSTQLTLARGVPPLMLPTPSSGGVIDD